MYALIDTNPEKAKAYVNKLSSIYIYLIKTKDEEIVSLEREIDYTKDYIFLIQTRFENDYIFNWNIRAETQNKYIPTSALQMLIRKCR